jgi:hypothetical protein
MDERLTALNALLGVHDWRAADAETRRLLVDDVDVGGYVGVDPDEASQLDCHLLVEIDTAWAKASTGRFAFSTQLRLLGDVMAMDLPTNDTWRSFGRLVGWVHGREWIEGDEVQYTDEAPPGHLPYVPGMATVVTTGRIYEGFMRFYARLGSCFD